MHSPLATADDSHPDKEHNGLLTDTDEEDGRGHRADGGGGYLARYGQSGSLGGLALKEIRQVKWGLWAVAGLLLLLCVALWVSRTPMTQLVATPSPDSTEQQQQQQQQHEQQQQQLVAPVPAAEAAPPSPPAIVYLPPVNCTVTLADLRRDKVRLSREEAEKNPVSAAFGTVYRTKAWSNNPEDGGSGSGSTPKATETIRGILRAVALKYRVRTMVDAPCGALAWMPLALEGLEEDARPEPFNYYGLDAAVEVINEVSERLKDHENWSFHTMDLSSAVWCDPAVDLILTRDALQHLDCPLIVDVLRNFAHSSARLLLVGSYPNGVNRRITTGDYFEIDLRKAPYNLQPRQVFNEWTSRASPQPDKEALLFDVPALRKVDFDKMKQQC